MAGHPLRPATRRRLGEPLPHQPADRTRAPPVAHLCFNPKAYGVLGSVSERYPPRQDSFSCFTHPSATPYAAPCFHFTTPSSNLHVLRTPPAFILSQDQTLSFLLQKLCLYLHAVFFCQVLDDNKLPLAYFSSPLFERQEVVYHGPPKMQALRPVLIFSFFKELGGIKNGLSPDGESPKTNLKD